MVQIQEIKGINQSIEHCHPLPPFPHSMQMFANFMTKLVKLPASEEILFHTHTNVETYNDQTATFTKVTRRDPISNNSNVFLPGFNTDDYECIFVDLVNGCICNVNVNIPLDQPHHRDLSPLTIIPLALNQATLDTQLKDTLYQLAKIYNVDFICTRHDAYKLLPSSQQCLYIVGNQIDTTHVQQVIQFVIRKFNLSQRIRIPSLSLATILLGPNRQNLDFFKYVYHIDSYLSHSVLPNESSNHNIDLYLGANEIDTTEATIEYINSIYSQDLVNLNHLITSNKKIYNIPLGKIEFLKRYRLKQLNSLSINHQSNIQFGPINHTTESCPIIINSISNDLANSLIRDLSLNVLQNIIEITFYYDSNVSSLTQLFDYILNEQEYVIILPSKTGKDTRQNCFTLIMDYNKLLLIIDQIIALHPNNITQFKIIFQIHYDFENFISGKKNGKLTRIMDQQPNCIIRLLNDKDGSEDSIMNLEILSDSPNDLVKTLSLVIDELPVEESFYIGEVFHRPIIGSGGSIIQTIMRKYNVFIQFSNSFNLPQLGWSLIRYPNVIIRCPNKNYKNIKSAKNEIIQLVNKFMEIQQFDTLNLTMAMYQYIIINKKHSLIPQIEKNFNVSINFPQSKDMVDHNKDPFILKIGSSNTTTTTSNLNDSQNNKRTSHNAMTNFIELVCGNETHFQMSNNFETFIKDELNWFKDSIALQVESLCKSVLKISPDNKSLQLIYPSSKEYEIALRYLAVLNDKFDISIVNKKHILGSPSSN